MAILTWTISCNARDPMFVTGVSLLLFSQAVPVSATRGVVMSGKRSFIRTFPALCMRASDYHPIQSCSDRVQEQAGSRS
jgi:hypothetical protein